MKPARSGDLLSPFPEEANRKITSQIAQLHLTPTSTSRANLLADAINPYGDGQAAGRAVAAIAEM